MDLRRQTQLSQQAFEFGFARKADANKDRKNLARKLLGFDFAGAMGIFNEPALSFDKLPTMRDALFRRVHLFAKSFLAHDSTG
jgi:hypothetical protein